MFTMPRLTALIIFFGVLIAINLCNSDIKPQEYTVNLDLPEEERWVKLLENKANITQDLNAALKLIWGSIPAVLHKPLRYLMEKVEDYLPQTYAREIKGIAAYLNLSISDVVLPNIMYDAIAFCTSIVAQDRNGHIWHGRNLDFFFADALRKLTVVVHFHRNGKLLYTVSTYAGMVGVITGQKPGVFTISLDERDKGTWWENLMTALLDRKAKHVTFFIRDLLETKQSFEEVLKAINDTDIIAPAYYIIAGTKAGQGAVITKGWILTLDDWPLDISHNRWYLVETNYDHWVPAPTNDDRRDFAIKYMNAVGQANINASTIYEVLSTPPLLRKETIYTSVMSARYPETFSTMIRYYKP